MNANKKRAVLALVLLLISSICALVFTACSNKQSTSVVEEVNVYGFDVKETLNVNLGESVSLEKPLVTDDEGNVLDVYYDVADINGGFVQTSMGSFIAKDVRGYTVTYKVVTSDSAIHKATTAIKVSGTSFSLGADYSPLVSAGDIVEISPVCSQKEAKITAAVEYEGEKVEVKDNSFVCDNVGVYTVTLTAKYGDEVGEYSYSVYSQTPMKIGEIESYGEDWSTVNKYAGKSRQGWSVVKASETSIPTLSALGENNYYRTITTDGDYIYVYANPRETKEYYKSLQAQGYKYVKIYVYCAGELEHMCSISTDPNNNCYRRDMYYGYSPTIPVLKPNAWNEVVVNLNRELDDFNRSFVDGLDYYASEDMPVLIIDNSVEYNVPGAGRGGKESAAMTVYIGGICAVKESDLSNTLSIDVAIAPELDFSDVDLKGYSDCEISVGNKTIKGDVLDLKAEKLDGTYRVTFYGVTKSGVRGELKVLDIDVYDSQSPTVKYCDVAEGNVSVFDNYKRADSLLQITASAPDREGVNVFHISGTEETAVKAKIFKSKEFLSNYSDAYLTFEYRVDMANNSSVNVKLAVGADGQPYATENVASGKWNVALIPMSYILDNYGVLSAYDVNSHTGKMIRVCNYSMNAELYFSKMTVVNLEITSDATVKYFDIGTSNLTDYYTPDSLVGIDDSYWTVDGVRVSDTSLSTESVSNGEHVIEYKVVFDGSVISTYVGKIDVVLYWQDVSDKYAKAYKYGKSVADMLDIVASAPDRESGSYYRVHYDKGIDDAEGALKVAPSHSKEILQTYFADQYLTFEYYIDVQDFPRPVYDLMQVKFLTTDNSGNKVLSKEVTLKTWERVYIPMSEVIENYDSLSNLTAVSNAGKLIYINTGSNYALDMYIGQITFSKTAE